MKILHVSDLHANLHWFDWIRRVAVSYDLVCIAGDLLDAGRPDTIADQMREVSAAIGRISTKVAVCSGNHDMVHACGDDNSSSLWVCDLKRPGVCADRDSFTLGKRRFYCHPWVLPLPDAKDGDIWIVHAPPEGTAVSQVPGGDFDHGDFEFSELCKAGRGPSIALCGHIHHPISWHATVGRTLVFNPGESSDPYVPAHIVVDLEQCNATRHMPGRESESVRLPEFSAAQRVLKRRTPAEIDSLLTLTVSSQRAEGIHMTEAEIEEARRRLRRLAEHE